MASEGDEYRTPKWLFRGLDSEFRFTVDVAATTASALTPLFIDKKTDALNQTWDIRSGHSPARAYCNPPYSQPNIPLFLERAYGQMLLGVLSVLVVPLDPTKAWKKWIDGKAAEVRILVPGRVQFMNADGGLSGNSSTKSTCVIVYRPGYQGPTNIWFWDRSLIEEKAKGWKPV
jgi:phage N-6-adenine-methyltransferase